MAATPVLDWFATLGKTRDVDFTFTPGIEPTDAEVLLAMNAGRTIPFTVIFEIKDRTLSADFKKKWTSEFMPAAKGKGRA